MNIQNYILKDLEKYIIIYLSKEEIKKLFLIIETFIETFNLNKTIFYNDINLYMKELDNKNTKLVKEKEISNFKDVKINIKYNYEKDEQPDIYLECIRLLIERSNCFNFALGKEELEIRNLNIFLGMDENPSLKNDDIQSFGKVEPFINSIDEQCKLKNYNGQQVYDFLIRNYNDLYNS